MEIVLIAACVIIPLLILFTKLHDGHVNVGDLFFCTTVGAIPIVNVIALLYITIETAKRHEFFSIKVF
jgi:hypothetical protein